MCVVRPCALLTLTRGRYTRYPRMCMSAARNQIFWVAEVEPATRVGRAYLPLRPGAEENAERAWLRLPESVRAQIELVGGFEAEPEDGPIAAEAWFVGMWLA